MADVIFDGTCQILPDEKKELDVLTYEQSKLVKPKENSPQNKTEM